MTAGQMETMGPQENSGREGVKGAIRREEERGGREAGGERREEAEKVVGLLRWLAYI